MPGLETQRPQAELPSHKPSSADIAARLLPLLQEYTAKLADWTQEIRDYPLVDKDAQSLRWEELSRKADPIRELAAQTSQLIEFGDLDPVTRNELRLRLADIEHALAASRHAEMADSEPAASQAGAERGTPEPKSIARGRVRVANHARPVPVKPVLAWSRVTFATALWALLILVVLAVGASVLQMGRSAQRAADHDRAVAAAVDLASYWNDTLDKESRYRYRRFNLFLRRWQKDMKPKEWEELVLFFIDDQRMNDAARIREQKELLELFNVDGDGGGRTEIPDRVLIEEAAYYRHAIIRVLNSLETVAVFRSGTTNPEAQKIADAMFKTASVRYGNELSDFIRLYRGQVDPEAWKPLTDFLKTGPWAR